jgi:hypothetical protein
LTFAPAAGNTSFAAPRAGFVFALFVFAFFDDLFATVEAALCDGSARLRVCRVEARALDAGATLAPLRAPRAGRGAFTLDATTSSNVSLSAQLMRRYPCFAPFATTPG